MKLKASQQNEEGTIFYLHLSDNTPVEEEEITFDDGSTAKVLWKDVLVEGEYPMSPGPGGAVEQKMTVIAEGKSDAKSKTIAMSDIIAAHEDGAFKYVTIPTSHKDGVLDNTGYVPRPKGVRVIEKDGRKVMQAALGFTEPDVKGKVQRGTIPDVSGGFFFNWLNKHTKKRFPCAMKHVALTNIPFMGNLDGFPAVFASDEEIDDNTPVEHYYFADSVQLAEGDGGSTQTGEIVWDETKGLSWTREQIEAALRPDPQPADGRPYVPQPEYYVQDVADDRALVTEYFKGDRKRWVIPYSRNDDGDISVAPATRWVEAKEAMIAASDNFEEQASAALREKLSVKLSEQLGQTVAVYRVDDVSLDQRVRISCKEKGQSWIAHFAMLDDGSVWLEPADQWEALEASDEPKDDAPRSASSTSSVVNMSDSIDDRLRAARQRRRVLLGKPAKSTKEV